MFGLGMGELFIIFAVAFILFGPQKLPQIARSLGEMVRKFKDETNKITNPSDDESKTPDGPKTPTT